MTEVQKYQLLVPQGMELRKMGEDQLMMGIPTHFITYNNLEMYEVLAIQRECLNLTHRLGELGVGKALLDGKLTEEHVALLKTLIEQSEVEEKIKKAKGGKE